MVKRLNVGIVGLGNIGKIHANAYRMVPLAFPSAPVRADLKAVWRTSLGRDKAFIEDCGFEIQTSDLNEFFDTPLDMVDICTPTGSHTEYVRRAVEKEKAIYCEKPLGKDLADARYMHALAQDAKVPTRMAFVLRFIPAIRQMKTILDSGELGDVLNFRGHIFHSSYLDPQRPMSWRLRFAQSGGGAFSDLGAHLLDLVNYLLGDVSNLRATMHTFIKQRPSKAGSLVMEDVDVDDWATCMLELESGVTGLVETARTAPGVPEDTSFQVFCQKGSLIYSSRRQEMLTIFDLNQNKQIQGVFDDAPRENERPISLLWPGAKTSTDSFLNAHLACQYDFLLNILEEKHAPPDFNSALKVQEVLEAAYTSAADDGEKVTLPLP